MIPPQRQQPIPHRRLRRLRLAVQVPREIPPPAAILSPAHQIRVRAGKRRRSQRRHHRYLVSRIVYRPQAVQHIPHLLRIKQQRPALQPIRNARILQPALQYPQPRARPHKNAHIPQPRRAFALLVLVIYPQAAHAPNDSRHIPRLPPAYPLRVIPRRPAEHHHRARANLMPLMRLQRDILSLNRLLLIHQLPRFPEHRVHPIHHRRLRPAIVHNLQRFKTPALHNPPRNPNIRPPKAVYGLLGIPHDKQLARHQRQIIPRRLVLAYRRALRRRKIKRDLSLQRICILKLVYEYARILPLKIAARTRIILQQIPRPRQHILEPRHPVRLAIRLILHREFALQITQQFGQPRHLNAVLKRPPYLAEPIPNLFRSNRPVSLILAFSAIEINLRALRQSRRRPRNRTRHFPHSLNRLDSPLKLLIQPVRRINAQIGQAPQLTQRTLSRFRQVNLKDARIPQPVIPAKRLRHLPPLARAHILPQQRPQRILQRGRRIRPQRPLAPHIPPISETLRPLYFVHRRPARRQPHRHRHLLQQLRRKAMDRLNRRLVNLVQSLRYAIPFDIITNTQQIFGILVVEQLLHPRANPLRKLSRRRLGECNRHNAAHLTARLHQRHHPAHQRVSLARSRARLHNEVRIQLAYNAPRSRIIVIHCHHRPHHLSPPCRPAH